MRSRSLRILLLGVFSLWFGVIVPGHERGAITVPGYKAPAQGQAAASCPAQAAHCGHCPAPATDPAKGPAPNPDPASHCAICHLTGVLDAPTTIHFTIPEAELLASLNQPAYRSIAAVAVLSTNRDRGPPALFI